MSSVICAGGLGKLSQKRSIIRSPIRASDRQPEGCLWRLPARHLQRRIVAQGIEVVAVFVPAGDRHHPRPDHRGETMPDPGRIAPVGEAGGQNIRDPNLALDLAQEQHPAIRRQCTAIKPGVNIEAVNG
jgi:hypothetical protein